MDHSATPAQNNELASWELTLAERVVNDFILAHGLPSRDLQAKDLVQECLIHWIQQRDRYAPERGASPQTFMRQVIRAKLLDIGRYENAEKRQALAGAISLNIAAYEDDEDGMTLADEVPNDEPEVFEVVEADGLRAAVERARGLLSKRQQQLLDGLKAEERLAEISRRLGVPRTTLNDELKRIRKVFRDQGLDKFTD